MSIALFLKLYLVSIPIFLVVDFLWLNILAKDFYFNRIGHMIEFNLLAAAVFYLIFLVGLALFATLPGTNEGSWQMAMMLGALFGFFTYATYDLTNLATLKGWPLSLVIVDMAWGTFLGAFVAALSSLTVLNFWS
jgi:uncharacterized membrane protein